MKKFIAFNGSANSGIQTKEKAVEWAANEISKKHGVDKIHVAEVIETVCRTVPSVEVKSFFVALEGDSASEAA